MSRRYETKYSDNWSARSGYVNQSNPHARFERPARFTATQLFIMAYCAVITIGTISYSLWRTW